MNHLFTKASLLFIALLSSTLPRAQSCGPWLPSLLLAEDKQQALRSPVTDFREELRRMPALPKLPAGLKPRSIDEQEYDRMRAGEPKINEGERADVEAAVDYYHVPAVHRSETIEGYWKIRGAMEQIRDPLLVRHEVNVDAADVLRGMPLPANLPAELADYLQGAIAFHCGQVAEARASWEKLLARPAAERHFRSTWAAYMLGRMAAWDAETDEAKCTEAKRWLQRVRTLAQEGCEDRLNLVGLSYYWEGTIESDDEKAASLYCLSFLSGCPWSVEALRSIGDALLRAHEENALRHAASVPLLRQLVTTCTVTRYTRRPYDWDNPENESARKEFAAPWLDAINAAHLRSVEDADRLAWVAYNAADFTGAARWLEKAPAEAPIAEWLRGKLALRAGRNAEATQRFHDAARHFPKLTPEIYPSFAWWFESYIEGQLSLQGRQLQADLGIAEMARAHFPQALDAFLRSGCWLDAAYVAEQVMTTQELLTFYRQHPELKTMPKPQPPAGDDYGSPVGHLRADAPMAFRYLLARRLAREGQLSEARAYLPTELRSIFDEYRADSQQGRNRRLPAEKRAEALWQAARIHRYLGMELFGAETAPDWSFFGGNYELDDIGALRAGLQKPPEWRQKEFEKSTWLPRITHEEITRNLRLRPTPNARFHYRYVAAELAWQAARLREPDEETASWLCITGGWLKARDPEAADRFYQELVGRCGQTVLGKEGERRKWFPPVEDEPFTKPLPPLQYW
jgi:hypothetical protein